MTFRPAVLLLSAVCCTTVGMQVPAGSDPPGSTAACDAHGEHDGGMSPGAATPRVNQLRENALDSRK